MSGEFVEFFNELLFGSGNWLGLVVFCILMLILAGLNKYGGLIAGPMGIFMGIEYGTRGLGWHAILTILEAIIILYFSAQGMRKKQ